MYCQSAHAQFRLFFSNYQSRQTTCIIFVNGRYIQHPQIRQCINGEFIKPVNFVFDLKIFDANEIDFNCHPQKLFVIINQLDAIMQSLHDEIHTYKATHKQFTIQQKAQVSPTQTVVSRQPVSPQQTVSPIFKDRQQNTRSQINFQIAQAAQRDDEYVKFVNISDEKQLEQFAALR